MRYVVLLALTIAATPVVARQQCAPTWDGRMACSGPLAAAHDNDELQARIRARIDQEVTRARNDQQIQDMIMEPFPGEER